MYNCCDIRSVDITIGCTERCATQVALSTITDTYTVVDGGIYNRNSCFTLDKPMSSLQAIILLTLRRLPSSLIVDITQVDSLDGSTVYTSPTLSLRHTIVHLPVPKINSPGGANTASGEYTELRSVA